MNDREKKNKTSGKHIGKRQFGEEKPEGLIEVNDKWRQRRLDEEITKPTVENTGREGKRKEIY